MFTKEELLEIARILRLEGKHCLGVRRNVTWDEYQAYTARIEALVKKCETEAA